MSVHQSIRAAAVAGALLAATVGCGTDDSDAASGPAAPSGAATAGAQPTAAPEATGVPGPTAVPGTSAAPEPTGAPAPSAAAQTPGSGAVPLLEGAVGTAEDPEAFELVLTDSAGQPVESLPAGDYDVRVQDPSTLHNFHLTGPGVDETTPVPGTGEVVWRVTLTAGEYTAVCDPHPDMATSFTVT